MNKFGDSFEDSIKNAFENASWNPPSNLWDSIEEKLELNSRVSVEEGFRKAFFNAEITPPDDIWQRIESDLRNRRIRVWTFRSLGVAAVLLLTLGFTQYYQVTESSDSATSQKSQAENLEQNLSTSVANDVPAFSSNREGSDVQKDKKSNETPSKIHFSGTLPETVEKAFVGKQEKSSKLLPDGKSRTFVKPAKDPNKEDANSKPATLQENLREEKDNAIVLPSETVIAGSRETLKKIDALPLPLILLPEIDPAYQPLLAQNVVYPFTESFAQAGEEAKQKLKSRNGYFIGLQTGVGSFRPNLSFAPALNASVMQGADSVVLASEIAKNPLVGLNNNFGVEAGFQINKRIYLVTGFELFSNRLSFEHTPYNLEKIIAPDFQTDSFMVADRNRLYVRNTFAAIPLIGEAHFGKGKLRFVLSGGGVFLVRNTTSFESEKSRYSYDFGETKPFGGMLRFGAGVSYALTNNLQLSFTGDYRSLTGNLSQKSGVQFAPENSSAVLRLRYLW